MHLVEVKKYGEFDMLCTDVVMTSPIGMTKERVEEIVTIVESANHSSRKTSQAISSLKSFGFMVIDTHSIAVGGYL